MKKSVKTGGGGKVVVEEEEEEEKGKCDARQEQPQHVRRLIGERRRMFIPACLFLRQARTLTGAALLFGKNRLSNHKTMLQTVWELLYGTEPEGDFGPGGVIESMREEAGGDLVDGGKDLVGVSRSSNWDGKARDVLGTEGVGCSTDNEPGSWWQIAFKRHQVRGIKRYALRHGLYDSDYFLRNWRLEGSSDGGESWSLIMEHNGDESLNGEYATHSWEVPQQEEEEEDKWFDAIRIIQTGTNSSGDHYLCLSGIELYATMRERPAV